MSDMGFLKNFGGEIITFLSYYQNSGDTVSVLTALYTRRATILLSLGSKFELVYQTTRRDDQQDVLSLSQMSPPASP